MKIFGWTLCQTGRFQLEKLSLKGSVFEEGGVKTGTIMTGNIQNMGAFLGASMKIKI